MKLKSIKTEQELYDAVEQGIGDDRAPVELVTIDGSIKSVRIGAAHITMENYSFKVTQEVEFEEVSRYRVVATIDGMPAQVSYFEDYSEMSEKARSYNSSIKVDTNNNNQVKVFVNDAGEVVQDDTLVVGDQAKAAPIPKVMLDNDIPF